MSQAVNLRESVVEINRHLERLSYNKQLQAWIRYEAGDVAQAVSYWEKAAESDDDKGLVARRSLAVHYHSQAYDLELGGRGAEAVDYWGKALNLWATIFQSQTFRGFLPRFSTVQTNLALDYADLDAFIEVLSESVLVPNQNLASRAVESADWNLAGQHIELIRKAGFRKSIYDPVLDRILQKLSPITHGTIEHTTFDEAGATAMEARADAAEQYFPAKINGKLALVVAAIWRAKKASETLVNIAPAWSKIAELHKDGFLTELGELSAKSENQTLAYLTETRLREIAEVACELELAQGISLWRQSNKAVARLDTAIDEANRIGSPRTALSAVENAVSIYEQFLHSDRDKARKICEELGARYGESPALSKLVSEQADDREKANAQLVKLTSLRKQARGY